jgi:propanediol dehydratase small subunit
MTNLSPAAQAVLDAFLAEWLDEDLDQDRCCLAAAFRAAADQVVPETRAVDSDLDYGAWEQQQRTRAELLAIAAELETQ